MGSETQPNLPVLDFTKENLKPGSSAWVEIAMKARNAFEEYGCFIAVADNKDSRELIDAVNHELEHLFDLPKGIKLQNVSDTPYFGYIGDLPHAPLYESLGIENATKTESIQNFSDLMWPSGNDRFCEVMCCYTKQCAELEQLVRRMVFESYGVNKCLSTSYVCRVMKYKAAGTSADEEAKLGAPAHTDKNFITILKQNEVNGLVVQTKDGQWIVVEFPPPPSSFLVMAGEAFLAWSNDRVHSTLHQVKVKGNKIRYSVALFSYIDEMVQVPEELVDHDHPLKFKPFDNYEFLRFQHKNNNAQIHNTAKACCGV